MVCFTDRAVATYEADEANASGNFSASNLPRVNFSPQICLNLASGKIFASHLPQFCLGCFFCLTRYLWFLFYTHIVLGICFSLLVDGVFLTTACIFCSSLTQSLFKVQVFITSLLLDNVNIL